MVVKINGSAFDTERVMRFAPHKKGGLDFQPDDVCTLSMMAEQADYFEKCGFKTWTVDKMGWRFMPGKISSATRCRSALHRSVGIWRCRNGHEKSR